MAKRIGWRWNAAAPAGSCDAIGEGLAQMETGEGKLPDQAFFRTCDHAWAGSFPQRNDEFPHEIRDKLLGLVSRPKATRNFSRLRTMRSHASNCTPQRPGRRLAPATWIFRHPRDPLAVPNQLLEPVGQRQQAGDPAGHGPCEGGAAPQSSAPCVPQRTLIEPDRRVRTPDGLDQELRKRSLEDDLLAGSVGLVYVNRHKTMA